MMMALMIKIHSDEVHHLKLSTTEELEMKVSRETMAEHREQIIAAAARRFREGGIAGISVADIMKEVGLTHGGFYGHFSSKEELVALASRHAMNETLAKWRKVVDEASGDRLQALTAFYLSPNHRPDKGCLMASIGSEISRQPEAVKEAVTAGQREVLEFLSAIAPGKTKALRRQQGIAALAAMVGGMILARGTSDPELRQEFLDTAAAFLPSSGQTRTKREETGTASEER
jgi:TetR/AcrR family transcriptional repressor of nem operon